MSVQPEGTVENPLPNTTSKIEPKVKWGAIGAYLFGVVALAIWNAVTADTTLLADGIPDALEVFIVPLVPAIGQVIAAYNAAHQWRRAEVPGQTPLR